MKRKGCVAMCKATRRCGSTGKDLLSDVSGSKWTTANAPVGIREVLGTNTGKNRSTRGPGFVLLSMKMKYYLKAEYLSVVVAKPNGVVQCQWTSGQMVADHISRELVFGFALALGVGTEQTKSGEEDRRNQREKHMNL
ncbi:hypothetical protein PanWU01x14_293770 [Parasponia andersonii]|uniref:Uncharacterized protein n=1 Tax=Parasponia andersonii TaxID=3476 RepID=A0A2P5AWI4_PARAD|nr:hypothetical protein PanWU01x14_293770 [Parasponia andersonii]